MEWYSWILVGIACLALAGLIYVGVHIAKG